MDESGEIRATGFNEDVDKLYDRLEEGKLYYVTKGRVALAKRKFSNTPNDFEITFNRETEIEEVSPVSTTCSRPILILSPVPRPDGWSKSSIPLCRNK